MLNTLFYTKVYIQKYDKGLGEVKDVATRVDLRCKSHITRSCLGQTTRSTTSKDRSRTTKTGLISKFGI